MLRMLVLAACSWNLHSHAVAARLCDGQPLIEVRKVGALPPALASAIGAGPSRRDIADADQPFNSSDVPIIQMPGRRLAVAGVGPSCAAVVIEQGGFVAFAELLHLRLHAGVWLVERRTRLTEAPKSLHELALLP